MKKIKLIALLAALVTGLCVYQLIQEINKPQEIPKTAVLTAAQDIREDTVITEEMLAIQYIPTEAVQPGCCTDPDEAVGKLVSSDMYAGEQMIRKRLVSLGEMTDDRDTLAYAVREGMRAVTIEVDQVTGIAGGLVPGNHVDVIMNYTYETYEDETKKIEDIRRGEDENSEEVSGSGDEQETRDETNDETQSETGEETRSGDRETRRGDENENRNEDKEESLSSDRDETDAAEAPEEKWEKISVPASRLLMQNIEVIAVGKQMGRHMPDNYEYSTVTLLVDTDQALKLSYAEFTGQIRLIARSAVDDDTCDADESDMVLDIIQGKEKP